MSQRTQGERGDRELEGPRQAIAVRDQEGMLLLLRRSREGLEFDSHWLCKRDALRLAWSVLEAIGTPEDQEQMQMTATITR
jgi:hypothetical protein